MNHRITAVAALACLLALAACKDRHEPLKPTVITPHFATVDRS